MYKHKCTLGPCRGKRQAVTIHIGDWQVDVSGCYWRLIDRKKLLLCTPALDLFRYGMGTVKVYIAGSDFYSSSYNDIGEKRWQIVGSLYTL